MKNNNHKVAIANLLGLCLDAGFISADTGAGKEKVPKRYLSDDQKEQMKTMTFKQKKKFLRDLE